MNHLLKYANKLDDILNSHYAKERLHKDPAKLIAETLERIEEVVRAMRKNKPEDMRPRRWGGLKRLPDEEGS